MFGKEVALGFSNIRAAEAQAPEPALVVEKAMVAVRQEAGKNLA